MSSSMGNYGFNIRKTKHQFFNNLNKKCTCFMLHKCMLHNTSQHSRLNEIYYVSIIRRTTELLFTSFSLSHEIFFISQFRYPLLICFSLSTLLLLTFPHTKFSMQIVPLLLWHKKRMSRTIN
jgi:hypothetical protein